MAQPHMISTARACHRMCSGLRVGNVHKSRKFASISTTPPVTARGHKAVIVGGGSAGMMISNQLLRSGKFAAHDIAVVDPATWHHYQPGWTLVGGGLKDKQDLRKPLEGMIDPKIKFYSDKVETLSPEDNTITLGSGSQITYDQLVVVPGININLEAIKGLSEALSNPDALVASTYTYDACDKVYRNLSKFRKGDAIFTHPSGIVKCAGAPQKIMWLALDHWKRGGYYNPNDPSKSAIQISFATSMATMFGVPKYSAKLNELREERGVEGLFQHDLVAIEGNTATFALPEGGKTSRHFDFLHVAPRMGPHQFMKDSPLVNEAGLVDVDEATTRHKKYHNVWSVGDASNLPTSKTAAAITGQGPVLVENLLRSMEGGEVEAVYDGYTSCPITTEYGKVMLAEFKYGGVPHETFNRWFGTDQATPRRAFYHMKKDFFPWVYYNSMVKGTWGGPKGWLK